MFWPINILKWPLVPEDGTRANTRRLWCLDSTFLFPTATHNPHASYQFKGESDGWNNDDHVQWVKFNCTFETCMLASICFYLLAVCCCCWCCLVLPLENSFPFCSWHYESHRSIRIDLIAYMNPWKSTERRK